VAQPQTPLGEMSSLPIPLTKFKGSTSKGRGREGTRCRKGRRERGKGKSQPGNPNNSGF